ncbi:hypothetical protein FD754_016546, partial [Muntiacus muntjak]
PESCSGPGNSELTFRSHLKLTRAGDRLSQKAESTSSGFPKLPVPFPREPPSNPLTAQQNRKEPAAKVSKGVKGKKEEKQEAGKEGTAAPAENGETQAEEIHISRSTVSVSASRGTPPSTLSVKGQIETVRAQKTESVANEGE